MVDNDPPSLELGLREPFGELTVPDADSSPNSRVSDPKLADKPCSLGKLRAHWGEKNSLQGGPASGIARGVLLPLLKNTRVAYLFCCGGA